MAGEKKKKSLGFSIMLASVIPVIILGVILTVYAQRSLREGMGYEVEQSLSGLAHSLISIYDLAYEGEFSYRDGKVMKGEAELTSDYDILDNFKRDTGADASICIGEKRCLTTIQDEQGRRLIGTNIPDSVREAVLEQGQEYFSKKISINGHNYYGYYVPIRNGEGKVTGISFAGKAVDAINRSVSSIIWRNVILCSIVILLASALCNALSHRIAVAIQSIKSFLDGLAKGDFSQEIPQNVMIRRDELAEIGEDAVIVSRSLENMVSRDPLTWLLNRRACMIQAGKRQSGEEYGVAMGDIDFFKKVNDQYGHEKGDEVLCYVAEVLQKSIDDGGFVSRWGGEEFLLVMEGKLSSLYDKLCRINDELEGKEFEHSGKRFQISMTFGVVAWNETETFETAINRADALLYFGKEHGRNQIVVQK